jgi:hypothetical protein
MEIIEGLFRGDGATVERVLRARPDTIILQRKTPNQRALACTLLWLTNDDKAPLLELFGLMAQHGHQATAGGGYGSEAGCPAPHDALWMGFAATVLRHALKTGDEQVLRLVVGYLADHLALCQAFWTPAGVRVAASRAKTGGGLPLRPTWELDSQFVMMVTTGAGVRNPFRPQRLTLDILNTCRPVFGDVPGGIWERAKVATPKLLIPVRRWDLPDGGMVAAQVGEAAQNDPLRWIQTDAAGAIVAASRTLDLPADLGEPAFTFGE